MALQRASKGLSMIACQGFEAMLAVPQGQFSLAPDLPISECSTSRGHPFVPRICQLFQARGMARKSAQQIRNGDILLRDDNVVRVSSFFWNHGKARGGGFISCDLVDIRTGGKATVRLKNDEMVETADLTAKTFQVLYTEEDKSNSGTVHLMDPQTYDQLAVPSEIFGSAIRWLTPDLPVEVKFLGTEEQPVTGSVPTKIRVKVTSAQPVLPRTDGTANRHVIVEGGVSVMVPGHIQEGDTIVVNTASAMYDSRAV